MPSVVEVRGLVDLAHAATPQQLCKAIVTEGGTGPQRWRTGEWRRFAHAGLKRLRSCVRFVLASDWPLANAHDDDCVAGDQCNACSQRLQPGEQPPAATLPSAHSAPCSRSGPRSASSSHWGHLLVAQGVTRPTRGRAVPAAVPNRQIDAAIDEVFHRLVAVRQEDQVVQDARGLVRVPVAVDVRAAAGSQTAAPEPMCGRRPTKPTGPRTKPDASKNGSLPDCAPKNKRPPGASASARCISSRPIPRRR